MSTHPALAKGAGRYDLVLLMVGVILLAAPFAGTAVRVSLVGLLVVLTLYTIWTSDPPHWLLWGALGISALAFATAAWSQLSNQATEIVTSTVSALLCIASILAIVLPVLGQRLRVDVRTLAASLAIFLLVGLFFSQLYTLIGAARDGGFFAQPGNADPSDYLYYSFITVTTVGYGDLTAATDAGHMLSAFEAVLGQLYLVTVVALVVSTRARRNPPPVD